MRNGLQIGALVVITLIPSTLTAQFNFTNGPSGAPVVPSMANQTCQPAGGGMGGGGACDGTPFLQEVVTLGAADYYHIVVGDTNADFGIEYYMRTAPGAVCWFGCAGARVVGMGGMAGGGVSPLSSSSGSATNDSAPLDPTNSGTGRPNAVAIRQVNRTPEITQEFLKATESNKPRITQTMTSANVVLNFAIDMSAINYSTSAPGTVTLTQVINEPIPPPGNNPVTRVPLPNSANFNIANAGPGSAVNITGGRFTYSPGAGDGGSLGVYSYFADSFNVYAVNWASYCDPAQNPVSLCVTYGGVRGGMGAAGGGMGGAAAGGAAAGGAAAGGAAAGGAAAGGMGGGATMGAAPVAATPAPGTTTGGGTATGGGSTMGTGTSGGTPVATTTTTTNSTVVTTTTTTTQTGMMGTRSVRR